MLAQKGLSASDKAEVGRLAQEGLVALRRKLRIRSDEARARDIVLASRGACVCVCVFHRVRSSTLTMKSRPDYVADDDGPSCK